MEGWVAKHPDSVLKAHVKRGENFEVDYAEFLEDALVECWDLNAAMEKNAEVLEKGEGEVEWWILKPGMSDRGQGIKLFSTMEELQGIFDAWEEERGGSDDEDEEADGDGIMASHLRHFIAQPYIHPPLLLKEMDDRKFHIRVYVIAVGCMKVYVYRDMLALFAAKPYCAPGGEEGEEIDLDAHLTNTCLQGEDTAGKANSVRRFWDLPVTKEKAEDIFAQICAVTGELFEAAARGMMVHFQPLECAFEVYGLDFLVDGEGTAWLLEVNAFPDFKQTGELEGIVGGFWKEAMRCAVVPWAKGEEQQEGRVMEGAGKMVLVREVDLGRRWGA